VYHKILTRSEKPHLPDVQLAADATKDRSRLPGAGGN